MRKDTKVGLAVSITGHLAIFLIPFLIFVQVSGKGDGNAEEKGKDNEKVRLDRKGKSDAEVLEKPGADSEPSEVTIIEKEGTEAIKPTHLNDECPEFYGGIGIQQKYVHNGGKGGYAIDEVYKGYPAYLAGIKPDDLVIEVRDTDIRGEVGTPITLVLQRGEDIMVINMIRDKICTTKTEG